MTLESIAKDLKRRYKREVLTLATNRQIQVIPTTIPTLDIDLGGGIALGRQTLITGQESSGKTSLAITIARKAIELGFEVIWIDTENSFDREWAKTLGLETDNNFYLMQNVTGERVRDYTSNILKAVENDKVLFVLDSIAGMVPENELENNPTVAPGARLVNMAIRVWNCLQGQLIGIILINQERDTLGKGFALPHGRAQYYHASQWVRLRPGGWITEKDDVIGTEIKWRIQKNKIAAPFGTGMVNFWFDRGYDKLDSLLTAATKLEILEQRGSYYYFGNESVQGRAKAVEFLIQNPEITTDYYQKVYGQMQHKIYRNGDETGN